MTILLPFLAEAEAEAEAEAAAAAARCRRGRIRRAHASSLLLKAIRMEFRIERIEGGIRVLILIVMGSVEGGIHG